MGRRAGGWIGALVLLAACSTDSGVTAVRSAPADVDQVDTGTEPAPSQPPSTDPADTQPPGTDASTTEPPLAEDAPPLVPSGDGAGDPLFPDLGNPGIDVEHYDVDLHYDPSTDLVAGSVTLTIVPTDDLDTFTLDSAGPAIEHVTVGADDAHFEQDDPELRITPPSSLPADVPVEVTVKYTVSDSSGPSMGGLPNGWFHTGDGSYVLNEPDGARTWLPSNDHPSDKATWTFSITVPDGVTAVANGALVSSTPADGETTWVWDEDRPMATYLVLLLTGDYEVVDGTGPNGMQLLSVVLRRDRERMQPYLDTIDDQIDFLDDWFGPYPFDRYGVAMSDSFGGLAMETQGRSLFSREDFPGGTIGYVEELLLSHELTHQWFGDAVTLDRWEDIWLNESFATYGQWMWLEHVGLSTVAGEADAALMVRQGGEGSPTGSPGADELFGYNSYDGGAVVLHALRRTIGDEAFFSLLRTWVADNVGTSQSTGDFIALAEQVAGTDLTSLFDDWLYADRLPAAYP